MKATQAQIITQVFGPETRTNYDATVHNAAVTVRHTFSAPSNATHFEYYTGADKAAFAKAVQKELAAQ